MKELRHLREEDFRSAFSMEDFLASCDRAFRLYGQGVLINPPRSETATEGYFRLEMPAEWPGKYRMRKIIEERSDVSQGKLGERQASILLEDIKKGVGVRLDADHITDMRTGAAGALGIKYLARTPVHRVAILGTGRIAQVLALAVDRLFELEKIRVTSRKVENRQAFQQLMEPQLGVSLCLTETLEACIQGVDVVLAAVPTPRPILSMQALEGVQWLVVLGGDGRTRQLEPEVLEGMGVVVDDLEQARRSGEFKYAQEAGRFEQISFAHSAAGAVLNIGDAACGRLECAVPSPRLVYCTGLAAQDLCAAAMIYENL
jgi:alanine dehydrogenase